MAKLTPAGERCLVDLIIPVDEDSVRAAKSKLILVRFVKNKPRSTTGIVIAVGNGPLIQETVAEGDQVFFSPHAGTEINIEGKMVKALEVHEIITVLRGTKEELAKINNPTESDPSNG